MLFSDILGHEHLKNHLTTSADNGRIPHAQIFSGRGVLPMAIAYAQYVLCNNQNGENNGENESCNLKFQKLAHPDLHFAYPLAPTDKIKKPVADDYSASWREAVLENPYLSLYDWYKLTGLEKKQGRIGVHEAEQITKKLSLKAYEGGYKVMIIWMAEKMNVECSNKLLKLLEEPPEKTIFLLLTEDEDQLLTTVTSRCQILRFPLLSEEVIATGLMHRQQADSTAAQNAARQAAGDYNKALQFLNNSSDDQHYEAWMISWVRTAFRAKGNKAVINDLLTWSEKIGSKIREEQKNFLDYASNFFRQAMLLNYGASSLVYFKAYDPKFSLEKFAPYIHEGNIMQIVQALEEAHYHIERNGNAKIIFTDLSIQLTRLLHKKAQSA